MGVVSELQSLQELHDKGTLTDAEFAAAKASVLEGKTSEKPRAKPKVRAGFIVALLVALGLIGWLSYGPVQFADQVENLPAHSYKTISFDLPHSGNFTVKVAVLHGNPVDVFVIGPDQLASVEAQKWNEVHPYNPFTAMKTQTYERTGQLPPGTYYLVLRDLSLGILSSRSSDISVKARLGL